MLGIFRFVLACMVALSHLWGNVLYWQGAFAVFCFYLVSGYLMTLILSEVYSRWEHLPRYVINRLLRIYPVYIVAFFLSYSVARAAGIGEIGQGTGLVFNQVAPLPSDITSWVANITLVLPWDGQLHISQAWSLRVELVYYALLPLLCRNVKVVLVWFLGSVALAVYWQYVGELFGTRYSSVLGASVAFSLGAIVYHLKQSIHLSKRHVNIAAFLFFFHLLAAPLLWGFSSEAPSGIGILFLKHNLGLYGNLFAGAYLLLAIVGQQRESSSAGQLDKGLGDIAYAVFLSHWIAAQLVVWVGLSPQDKLVYVPSALALTLLLSVMMNKCIEEPVNRYLRDRVRPSKPALSG